MRKTGWSYLLAVACLGGSLHAATSAAAAGRVALVIGNAAYDNLSPLGNPVADASRMTDLLVANGFDVMSCDGVRKGCFDLSRADLLDALDDFRDMAEGAELALAFYAGHGMQTDSGNVIAPTDIELDCGDWKAKREVLLDDVLEAMEGAREKIVILDACRNDPFKAQQCVNRGVRPLSFGSFAVPQSTSRFLLVSSTQNGQVAQDGLPGTHSPFAESLFHWMERAATAKFDQLFDRVAKRVIETTAAANFTQIPEVMIRGGAPEICLAGAGCGGDPQASELRAEVDALKAESARNREYEGIVVALVESGGLDIKTIDAEQKEKFFASVMAATRSLAARGESGAPALAALRDGDLTLAESVFLRDIGQMAAEHSPADRQRVSQSALNLAALHRARRDAPKATRFYEQATALDPENLGAWIGLAETRMDAGDLMRARAAYEKGRAVAGHGMPADRVWVIEGLADTYWSADPDRSLALYKEANALALDLSRLDPQDSGLRRGLVVTHYNIGHIAMDRKDIKAALRRFRAGLGYAESLAREYPGDLRWQFDIGRGHERIGRALLAGGDRAGALRAFLTKQVIAERLARSGEATYVQDAALADEFLADIAVADGDFAMAEMRYQASLDRMTPLRELAPGNAGFRRFTSVTQLALGDAQIELGKTAAAWENFAAAAATSEALVVEYPGNAQWGWDLFRAYQRLATTRPPGVDYHAKALAVIEKLKADGLLDADNEKWIGITRERLLTAQTLATGNDTAKN